MESEVRGALNTERRTLLFNLEDPGINKLYACFIETISPHVKSGTDVGKLAEPLLLSALLYASKDKLSGLSSKERFKVETEAAMTVAKKLNIPLVLIMMDGRGFEEVNDTIGHLKGDEVIAAIGDALQKSTRSTDATISQVKDGTKPKDSTNIEVVRNGGDEFAAVLLGTDEKDADAVIRRMQDKIAKTVNEKVPELKQILGHSFEMTFGLAQYDPSIHKTAQDLIKAADDNLTEVRQQAGQPRR